MGYYLEYELSDYMNGDYGDEGDFCKSSYDKIISSVRIK